MKESIKMEDYDGFLGKFTKQEKTKILPLRWFANFCESRAHYHLEIFLYSYDRGNHGVAFKCHGFLSNLFYKPYFKWGTYYKLEVDSKE
jgi:hypothetical protein